MDKLPDVLARKLTRLGSKLIDQQRGRLLVQPTEDADGFWFGGGNCVRDPRDGSLLLIATATPATAAPAFPPGPEAASWPCSARPMTAAVSTKSAPGTNPTSTAARPC